MRNLENYESLSVSGGGETAVNLATGLGLAGTGFAAVGAGGSAAVSVAVVAGAALPITAVVIGSALVGYTIYKFLAN